MLDFIRSLAYDEIPVDPRDRLVSAVLDLLSSMIAGAATPTACITADFAASTFPGEASSLVGHGRVCGVAGAALANACAANALDIDDGYRPAKGHPGAVVVPTALAQAEAIGASGPHFLSAVSVGYEIAMRASVAWHAHQHRGPSYHGSGSWGALGAAAACAHLRGLGSGQTRNALGLAEYQAPLAPIMTCVEHPSMAKDGIHWGALVGATSADLAERGFTGIPSILESSPDADVGSIGSDWWVLRLYTKYFPCCRWAQPAVACVLRLREAHALTSDVVRSVKVHTFEAATHLVTRRPATTEEAQYSLAFPVACALARGTVGVDEIAGSGLHDRQIIDLVDRVEMEVDADLDARFPEEALSRVTIQCADGSEYATGPMPAPGDADSAVTVDRICTKSHQLLGPVLGSSAVENLIGLVLDLPEADGLAPLASLLSQVPTGSG